MHDILKESGSNLERALNPSGDTKIVGRVSFLLVTEECFNHDDIEIAGHSCPLAEIPGNLVATAAGILG